MVSREDICAYAREIQIDLIGFADTKPLDFNYKKFTQWISSGYAGDMAWLLRDPEKRFSPSRLMPDVRTIISIGLSYFSHDNTENNLISRYVRAKDYHQVLKDKLNAIYAFMKREDPALSAKIFIDTGPIAEKAIAQKAGLGWQGKHSILINKDYGSWIFLGELLINRDYPIDTPQQDHCGDCRLCIDACPANAILDNRSIDVRKCISYLTIGYKGEFSKQDASRLNGRLFGCDICQDICPWNKTPLPARGMDFIRPSLLSLFPLDRLFQISEEEFLTIIKETSLKKFPYSQFRRNLASISKLTS